MEIKSIVTEFCGEADDFLAGVTKRDEARAGIAELLTIRYAALPAADKKAVVTQVMQILEREGFFSASPGGED
jgi:hypothetical protein